jgi:Protein of unknown function (DUF998)
MQFLVTSLVSSAASVLLIVAAHLLKPEIDPRRRMLSELSIGRLGRVMDAAFVAWSVSNLSLAAGLWPLVPGWIVILLGVVSLGPLGAAFAVTDPIATPRVQQSTTGRLHALFGTVFIFGFPVVTALFAGWSLLAASPLWPWFAVTGALVWASLISFLVVAARSAQAGLALGARSPIGIPNRLSAAACVAWTVSTAVAALPLVT